MSEEFRRRVRRRRLRRIRKRRVVERIRRDRRLRKAQRARLINIAEFFELVEIPFDMGPTFDSHESLTVSPGFLDYYEQFYLARLPVGAAPDELQTQISRVWEKTDRAAGVRAAGPKVVDHLKGHLMIRAREREARVRAAIDRARRAKKRPPLVKGARVFKPGTRLEVRRIFSIFANRFIFITQRRDLKTGRFIKRNEE